MKCKYLILLSFFSSLSSHGADGLGRLFLTPEQRTQLDVARVKRDQRAPATTEAAAEPAATAPQYPGVVTYSGAVRRNDGKSTVWLNGKPVTERNRLRNDSEVSVLGMGRDGALSVAIPQAQRTASLKVGQSLDVVSGRIEESYAGRMSLAPPPKEPASPPASQAAVPANAVTAPRSTRPLRDSYFKEADSDSGAAPAIQTGQKK